MTNSGQLLIIEGAFEKGALTMSSDNLDKDGKRVWYRVSWKQQTAGKAGVRETAVTSKGRPVVASRLRYPLRQGADRLTGFPWGVRR